MKGRIIDPIHYKCHFLLINLKKHNPSQISDESKVSKMSE